MVSLKYILVGNAWLSLLYHLTGCVVGASQGLIHGLFRGSSHIKQRQRASTRAASQKRTPGVLFKAYCVAGYVAGISQERGSDRARRKPPKKHGNTWHPPVTGFKQTKQKLFAWLISARSSARAARFGAAAEAPTHTCLSSLGTLCSRVAAALAAQFSCEAAGAGYAASGAAHAAKPYRVSSGGIPKSAMESRSSFDRVTHRSQKDDRTSGSPAELLMHQAQELFDLGLEALDQLDFVRALDMFNAGLKLNSADKKLSARLHHNKGCALVELKQYALAIVECCKAIDLDKDMWHPYIVRHLAWRHVGLYTKAAEDLVVAQGKGGPCKQHFIHAVAKADSMQYSALLGLGSIGKLVQKRDVQIAYRGLMRECHPDKAPNDQKHEHQRDVANILAQYLNVARDKLQASL